MKRIYKSGQHTMGMPFAMIFAIFLIVVFVVIAFIAVRGFLNIGDTTRVGLFYDKLQKAVDEAWSGQSSEFNFEIDLPNSIKEVCFGNLSAKITNKNSQYNEIIDYKVYDANTFLIPPEKAQNMQWKLIKHLNIYEITKINNPYCVSADKDLKISKGFYDKLVIIQ